MALSPEKTAQLVALLHEMGDEVPDEVREALKGTKAGEALTIIILTDLTFPVPPKVFDPWCGASITNPFELIPISTERDKVLMFERHDHVVDGWHFPGTVIIPGDTIANAQQRLLTKEVKAGVSTPEFVAVVEFSAEEHRRGQEISLLHACWVDEDTYTGDGRFFPINDLPSDTYSTHLKLLETVRKRMSLLNHV